MLGEDCPRPHLGPEGLGACLSDDCLECQIRPTLVEPISENL